jgi:hypothetical protein
MMWFAVQIELANIVAVQCLHHADPREHRRPVKLYNQQQRFHRCLPFVGVVFCLGQLGDVVASVLQRDELGLRRTDRE